LILHSLPFTVKAEKSKAIKKFIDTPSSYRLNLDLSTQEDPAMISRFFKKKPKPVEPKKPAPKKEEHSSSVSKKILTAEGWKRMMMRKSGKNR